MYWLGHSFALGGLGILFLFPSRCEKCGWHILDQSAHVVKVFNMSVFTVDHTLVSLYCQLRTNINTVCAGCTSSDVKHWAELTVNNLTSHALRSGCMHEGRSLCLWLTRRCMRTGLWMCGVSAVWSGCNETVESLKNQNNKSRLCEKLTKKRREDKLCRSTWTRMMGRKKWKGHNLMLTVKHSRSLTASWGIWRTATSPGDSGTIKLNVGI